MRNEQDARDVAQEACLRAFRFFPGFRGGDARAWLLKIVRNTCYTWLHVNRPMRDAAEFDEKLFAPNSRVPNPEEAMLQIASDALVRKALEQLPLRYREVIILRELEGMSYREIADITGVPAGTVMSSLSRARGRLRQLLTALMIVHAAPTSGRLDECEFAENPLPLGKAVITWRLKYSRFYSRLLKLTAAGNY